MSIPKNNDLKLEVTCQSSEELRRVLLAWKKFDRIVEVARLYKWAATAGSQRESDEILERANRMSSQLKVGL